MEYNTNNTINIAIPIYSGPLETLLDLAKNQKVDLAQISITTLADHFLEFIKKIGKAKKVKVSVIGKFIKEKKLLLDGKAFSKGYSHF